MNPWGVQIYDTTKFAVLGLGLGALSVLTLVDFLWRKRGRVFFSRKIGLGVLALLLVLGLSWWGSLRPWVSFFGSSEKLGGILSLLHYVLLFVLSLEFMVEERARTLFLRALSWSGIVVSAYALLQKCGVDFLPQTLTDLFEGRSFSTLGNPSALATFLLFPIGAELMLWKRGSAWSWGRLLVLLAALLASRGRASILGLGVAGFLFLIKRFRADKKRLAALVGLAVVAVLIFAGLSSDNTRSLRSRFALWQSSIDMISERPFLGTGLENFSYVFPAHVTAAFYENEDYFALADRPHNEFLEWWIHLGVLGAGLYVALVLWVLLRFWRSRTHVETVAGATLLAVFVSNAFGFSLLTHFVGTVLFLALLVRPVRHDFSVNKLRAIALTLLGAALLLLFSFPLRFFVGDFLFKKADNAYLAGDTTAVALLTEAQQWNPYFAEYFNLSFKIDFGLALAEENVDFLQAAADANAAAYAIDLGSLKTMTNAVQLYALEGRNEDAENILHALDAAAPVQPLLYQITGEYYYSQKKYAEAALAYEKLLAVLPDTWKAPVITQQEMSEPSRIFWKNHPDFFTVLQHLADSYLQLDRDAEAEALLLELQ